VPHDPTQSCFSFHFKLLPRLTTSLSCHHQRQQRRQISEELLQLKDGLEVKAMVIERLEAKIPEIESLQGRLDERDARIEELREEIADSQQAVSDLHVKVDDASRENVDLTVELVVVKAENSDLSNKLTAALETSDSFEQQVANRLEEMSAISEDRSSLTTKLNAALFELTQSQNEVDCITSEKKQVETELEKTTKELTMVAEDKVNLELASKGLRRQIEADAELNKAKFEEFTRRLLNTQKELNEKDDYGVKMNEERKEIAAELARAKDAHELQIDRWQCVVEEQNNEMESIKAQISEAASSKNDQEAQMWKKKYEDLNESIGPFKAQLKAFDAEKNYLLNRNNAAEAEVDELGQKYAALLGHQNSKQKIRHVVQLKSENNTLKQENLKLKSQVDKLQKQAISNRKLKFDPKNAFTSGSSGSTAGKENKDPK